MKRRAVSFLIASVLLVGAPLLSGCSGGSDAPPGTTTADEDRQLNEAAAMLDANSIDLNTVDAADAPDTNESNPR